MKHREISYNEIKLIKDVLKDTNYFNLTYLLEGSIVFFMNDGGMGSIQFVSNKKRKINEYFSKDYFDSDGVPLIVTVIIDLENELYEVDIWKVDFSPLIRHPGDLL